jgi:hypothetical protein
MQTYKYGIKTFVLITVFLFFSGFLFAQKTLDHELFLEKVKHGSDNI